MDGLRTSARPRASSPCADVPAPPESRSACWPESSPSSTGTAVAQKLAPTAAAPVLEATHLPPLLTLTGERVELRYDVFCAAAGTEAAGAVQRDRVGLRAVGERWTLPPVRSTRDPLRRTAATRSLYPTQSRSGGGILLLRGPPHARGHDHRSRKAAPPRRSEASRSASRSTSPLGRTCSVRRLARTRASPRRRGAAGRVRWARAGKEHDADRRSIVRRHRRRHDPRARRGKSPRPAVVCGLAVRDRGRAACDQRDARRPLRRRRRHDARPRDDERAPRHPSPAIVLGERRRRGRDRDRRPRLAGPACGRRRARWCSSSRRASGCPPPTANGRLLEPEAQVRGGDVCPAARARQRGRRPQAAARRSASRSRGRTARGGAGGSRAPHPSQRFSSRTSPGAIWSSSRGCTRTRMTSSSRSSSAPAASCASSHSTRRTGRRQRRSPGSGSAARRSTSSAPRRPGCSSTASTWR